MNTEGRGESAPGVVVIPLTDSDLMVIKERSVQQAMERDYRRRGDAWGQGLTGGLQVKNSRDLRPDEAGPFIGMIGEYGVCSYLNRRLKIDVAAMDFQRRQHGDGGVDLKIFGLTIQVKTRTKSFSVSLIKRAERSGLVVPLSACAYAFCQYTREQQNVVQLLGWSWARSLLGYPLVPARRGDHMNIEVPDVTLLPMTSLIDELKQRKASEQWR